MGFLERCGISPEAFTALVSAGADDDELVRYFDEHASPAQRAAANAWVLVDNVADLDEQDREEGRTSSPDES